MYEGLWVGLDILLASFTGALLTRFWTRRRLEATVSNLEHEHRRFGLGALLLVPATLLLVPGTVHVSKGGTGLVLYATLAAYGFFLLAAYLLYSAATPDERFDGGEGA